MVKHIDVCFFIDCIIKKNPLSIVIRFVLLQFIFIILAKDYGLFLADEDVKKGVWLEPGRNLEYYILRNGVSQYYFY